MPTESTVDQKMTRLDVIKGTEYSKSKEVKTDGSKQMHLGAK